MLLLGTTFPDLSQAQDLDHPIDVRTRACLDSVENQTTMGMIGCARRAYEAWDKELNKNYKLLMGVLSAEEKEKLKVAQRNWITWRDSETGFSGTVYGNIEGTMWRTVSADRYADITRQRALDLKVYYDNVAENK